MRSLTEKQRKFVIAMANDPLGNAAKWARAAGYSDHKEAAKVAGHMNLHNEAVRAAAFEIAQETMLTIGPILATTGLIRMAKNPRHKHHARAVEALANRVGLHEVQEIRHRHSDQSGEAMAERVTALAKKLGIDPAVLLGGGEPVPKFHVKQIEGTAGAVIEAEEVKDAG